MKNAYFKFSDEAPYLVIPVTLQSTEAIMKGRHIVETIAGNKIILITQPDCEWVTE